MTPDTIGQCISCDRDMTRDDLPPGQPAHESGAAMCIACLDACELEHRQHVGRLLLQARIHAAPLTLVHSAFSRNGPDALKDAEWDAEALMLTLDALHAELAIA